jgi:purine-nucleoside phosphorylase
MGPLPSADIVRSRAGEEPFEMAIILGSGLGVLAEEVLDALSFSYGDFPDFPLTTAKGHPGRLVAGVLEGRKVLLFAGRFHLYEGYDARQVTTPVRLAHALGCRHLLLTNASGGINDAFSPGDIMFITDHINLMGDNPLRGEPNPFIDLTALYERRLFGDLSAYAEQEKIRLHQGVLAALPGPSYETPAEIRMLRLFGADAVSMSTIPEAIMARYLGMEVAGLSVIANAAAGLAPAPLDHDDVLLTGRTSAAAIMHLIRRLISQWIPSASH